MLNALCVALATADPNGVARAARSLVRQGMTHTSSLAWAGGRVGAWATASNRDVMELAVHSPAGDACSVGPLWYRRVFGRAALELLLAEAEAGNPLQETELRGNFVLCLHTCSGRCLLMNDLLGFARVYASRDGKFYSTSWLAACAYAGCVEVDPAAAIEYVLLGASHSEATVAQGVSVLPLGTGVDLVRNAIYRRSRPWDDGRAAPPQTPAAACDAVAQHLVAAFADIAAAFPGRLRIALSAGFDSRLIVAAALHAGADPHLFVYGGEGSPDVAIARSVAANLGRPIEVVDKRRLDQGRPLPDLERLVASALFFDGLPNDGILDRGSDAETRLAHTAGGQLALSGGGGEILRNYFHLSNGKFTASQLVNTFYRGFDRRALRTRKALHAYVERVARSILSALGAEHADADARLERTQVELAYPLFRCHHWMAVNTSAVLRHGFYLTPLIDPASVALACGLPMRWKNGGRLEGHAIAALHRELGWLPNGYGFPFAAGPDTRARVQAWLGRHRPVCARPLSNAVGRRLRGQRVDLRVVDHYRALLPGEWRVDGVLDLRRLPDAYAFARALSIEVVWRQLLA